MTGIDSWSVTPASNATADGGAINWAENQAPSTVNNTARQMLADERSRQNDLIWFQYGTGDQGAGNLAVPAVYSSGTAFTIAGVNVTAVYHAGRRVRAVGSGTGTIYGSISSSSFSTNTTVNVTWDSGSLSNETLVVSLSQIPVTGSPVPAAGVPGQQSWTPADASGGSLTFTGVSVKYQQVGNMMHAYGQLTFPATSDTNAAQISGLPITVPNQDYATMSFAIAGGGPVALLGYTVKNTTRFRVLAASNGGAITNAQLSTTTLNFMCIYPVI